MAQYWEEDVGAFTKYACSQWLHATDYATPTEGRLRVTSDSVSASITSSKNLYETADGMKVKINSLYRAVRTGDDGCDLTNPELLSSNVVNDKITVLSSASPDGKLKASIVSSEGKGGSGKKSYTLLIHKLSTQTVSSVDLSTPEVHGTVCPAGQFGNLIWSPDQSKLAYVADVKPPKAKSYFAPASDPSEGQKDPAVAGAEHVYRDNWGEQLSDFHHTVLVVLDWAQGSKSMKLVELDNRSIGQPVWASSDGNKIAFTAWEEESPRLGLIYCTQRPSNMYIHDLAADTTVSFGREGKSSRSPTVNPYYTTLVYVEQDARGPHHGCGRLMAYDLVGTSGKARLSVSVETVDSAEGDAFQGLFCWSTFVPSCWSSDGSHVYVDTQWRSSQFVVSINVAIGSVHRIATEAGTWSLLDVQNDVLLVTYSNPANTPSLRVVFTSCDAVLGVKVKAVCPLNKPTTLPISFKIVDLMPEKSEAGGKADGIPFQAYYVGPDTPSTDEKSHSLVVFPHGGPHSSFSAGYSTWMAASALLGFYTVAVNYRGSSGFGQDNIMSLPGKIGVNDVKDVQVAALQALQDLPVDPAKVFVHGGSHGGFLSAHAIGQYPTFYKAACIRNPVIDLPVMFGISDIPDWNQFEAGWEDKPGDAPTSAMMKMLLECSPVVHIDKVKAPTLMLIGEQDKRVPSPQGHRYVALLKHRGVKAKLLSYPEDCHPLQNVKTQADNFVNMAVWFKEAM